MRAAISGMMKFSHKHHNAREMDAIRPHLILQRWNVVQHELLPELKNEVGALTPKLERVIHTLEWVRIEQFVSASWCGTGRPLIYSSRSYGRLMPLSGEDAAED